MFLLRDLRFPFLALQFELLLMLSQPTFANGNFRFGLDADALLALFRNQCGQTPHALRIECVVLVPLAEVALVNSDQ